MKKKDFYPHIEDLFAGHGYRYYPEEKIKGLGRGSRKPDFVAVKKEIFAIGEIKSPAEPPQSSSWRSVQPYDSPEMEMVRKKVKELEASGQVSPEIGGHAIILLGQLKEYMALMGKRWVPPESPENKTMLLAYAFPSQWSSSVAQALEAFGLNPIQHLKGDLAEAVIFFPKETFKNF